VIDLLSVVRIKFVLGQMLSFESFRERLFFFFHGILIEVDIPKPKHSSHSDCGFNSSC
jgi:hypothetical protein